jgi:hypothetical protein
VRHTFRLVSERFAEARIRSYLPILVERAVRRELDGLRRGTSELNILEVLHDLAYGQCHQVRDRRYCSLAAMMAVVIGHAWALLVTVSRPGCGLILNEVSRQTLHTSLTRYREAGLGGLMDRSHRPARCSHEASVQVETWV